MESDRGGDAVDVAIVGGGLSGLSAARRLRARGRTVAVLEARNRVGGKMWTGEVGGHHVDLGAHWIGPTQDRVAALARELGVRTAPQPLDGRAVLVSRGRRRTFRGSIPPLSPLSIAELGIAQLRLDRLRRKVSLDHPWVHAAVTDWDAQTVDAFARRYLRTRDARMFLSLATELVFGAEIEELSLLYFLFYLASGGGLTALTEFEGGAQQDHFVGGSQQLCDRLAEQLGNAVRLRRPVAAVEQSGDGVLLRTMAGEEVRAGHAIVAVSPALYGRWHWARPLPADRDQLAQRMPMGAYMKVALAYERAWWRDGNLSGIAYSDTGPVQMVVDSGSRRPGGACSPASSPGARSSATGGWSWARARPPCASH